MSISRHVGDFVARCLCPRVRLTRWLQALDGLATAMGGGVDVGEMLVGVNQVTAAWDGTIGSLHGLWNATWGSRAEAHMASAESLLAKGYKRRAARTFRKYVHCDRETTCMCDTGVGAEPPRTSSWRSASWTT